MEAKNNVLHKPIKTFNPSPEFLEMCNKNEFKTLNEIIYFPVNELLSKPQFNHRILKELYSILKKNKLENTLKEN
jgi:hypothetical protein